MGQYWPISIVWPKLPVMIDSITVIAIILLAIALWKNSTAQKPFWQQMIIVWCIILSTNLLQGFNGGFIDPIDSGNDDGFDYWQDTLIIHDPIDIIKNYETLQPTLGYHSRVHPPLALFTYYYLRLLFHAPWLVGIIISIISLSGLYFYKQWLAQYTKEPTTRYFAILIGLTPAFQIYSLASIDAIIATLFILTIWSFDRKNSRSFFYLTVILLITSMLFNFGAIWLIALLFFIDLIKNHTIKNISRIIGATGAILFALYLVSNYSYLKSFIIAASFEGNKNFFLSPSTFFTYVLTRIQDILEPAVFLGPFLLILLYRSLKTNIDSKHKNIKLISYSAMGIFAAFLLTGAYYTGETARAALYIIMPILAPISLLLNKYATRHDYKMLGFLVLTQTTLMQLFGYYLW
jgi:hypothetical protein